MANRNRTVHSESEILLSDFKLDNSVSAAKQYFRNGTEAAKQYLRKVEDAIRRQRPFYKKILRATSTALFCLALWFHSTKSVAGGLGLFTSLFLVYWSYLERTYLNLFIETLGVITSVLFCLAISYDWVNHIADGLGLFTSLFVVYGSYKEDSRAKLFFEVVAAALLCLGLWYHWANDAEIGLEFFLIFDF